MKYLFYIRASQISIHALRGEGDVDLEWYSVLRCHYFNPRPPWGGRRGFDMTGFKIKNFNPRPPWGGRHDLHYGSELFDVKFQSTPSVGRATHTVVVDAPKDTFQSTPSVGRATMSSAISPPVLTFQSTPSVGRATVKSSNDKLYVEFQSTPSVGRATSR